MNRFDSESKRNIIPRWREFNKTAQLGELSSLKCAVKEQSFGEADLAVRYYEWSINKTLPYAADLVSASFAIGNYDYAQEAAEFILQNEFASEFAKDIARKIILDEPEVDICSYTNHEYSRKTTQERVKFLRALLAADPRNSIAWTDIAREYTILGERVKAVKAMEIALNLTPENRFVLRSACRLYHHFDDPGRALYVLRRSDAVKYDPWVTSAEIASTIAVGKNSGLIRTGINMTEDKNLNPIHITELSAALGTVELHNNENRASRKLFLKSLQSPNDNSFAQAVWASKIISSLDTEEVLSKKEIPCLFEAHAIKLIRLKDWEGALRETEMWLDDQPFSRMPATMGSYLAADGLEDYNRGAEIALRGLHANPSDNALLNNLAFSYANLGKITEAEQCFSKINLLEADNETRIIWNATKGLILFRKGIPDEGREYYSKAIELASGKEYKEFREAASVYLAREELLANTSYAPNSVALAENECKDSENDFNKAQFARLKLLQGK